MGIKASINGKRVRKIKYGLTPYAKTGKILVCGLANIIPEVVPTSGLVAQYLFNGDTQDSVGDNHLTNNGGVFVPGYSNQAIRLGVDAGCTLDLNTHTVLQNLFSGTNPYTVTCLFRGWDKTIGYLSIIKASTGQGNFPCSPEINVNNNHAYYTAGNYTWDNKISMDCTLYDDPNTLNFMCARREANGAIHLRINKISADGTNTINVGTVPTMYVMIPDYNNADVILDNLRIWNRSLTDAEVAGLDVSGSIISGDLKRVNV